MKKSLSFIVSLFLLTTWLTAGQQPAQETRRGSLSSEEIIKAFSAKETEFYEAWKQYTYRQIANIKILSVNGYKTSESLTLISEVVFNDDGTREVQLVGRRGSLKSVAWTPEDTEVITNIQPFALTTKELPLYDLKYEGKEKADELDCYVFSVKPKQTKGGRIYFQGKIWVDDQDLQIVRTIGKPVPQRRENQFPDFETIRQVIDDKYWFPVWTRAGSSLSFPNQTVRVEETITYEDYKRFGVKATIDYGTPKP